MTGRDTTQFVLLRMDQDDAETVSGWRYEELYSFYGADANPEDLADLLSSEERKGSYFSVRDERDGLVGFFGSFEFTVSGSAVEIGLGLRPDLTGKGIGLGFLQAGMAFARGSFAASDFQLSVATFNRRAIRRYEKAGFQLVSTFVQKINSSQYEFLRMSRQAKLL